MDVTQPALAGAGAGGVARLSWTAPTLTEHALFWQIAVVGPAKMLGLIQGIGFTCPNPPNCPS
jgi:hypothetical protein